MPTFQNTGITQSNSPWYGSAKIEVSLDNGNTYTNVGLARGVNFNETQEINDIQADNGPDLDAYVSDHFVELTFNSLEVYLPTYDKIRGGIDILTQVSTGVSTTTDVYSTGGTSADKFLSLSEQGTGDTGITIGSVIQVSTGNTSSTLTAYDDYTRSIVGDVVGITPLGGTGSAYNSTESLRINYSYNSVASNRLSSGGLASPEARWYRLTNVKVIDGVNKYRYIYLYSSFLNAGLNLAFKSDSDADPILEGPFNIKAKLDTTRTAGDQLFLIDDQQGVA